MILFLETFCSKQYCSLMNCHRTQKTYKSVSKLINIFLFIEIVHGVKMYTCNAHSGDDEENIVTIKNVGLHGCQ